MKGNTLKIASKTIKPGECHTVYLPTPKLYTYNPFHIPIHVINSQQTGPILLICASIHGNEISGIEIIRRLHKIINHKNLLNGTLITIPVVNIYGFIFQSRYLPDHRDLNRHFPGSRKGSFASRLAYLFMHDIVEQCTHGIDLHSGSLHHCNMPQVRVNLKQRGISKLAQAFGTSLILNATLRDGSLRQASNDMHIPILVYEAGEALRFQEAEIHDGIQGILNVMRTLKMITGPDITEEEEKPPPTIAHSSFWLRAPCSGMMHLSHFRSLGEHVEKGSQLGIIADPFGKEETPIIIPEAGMIIGYSTIPLINEGSALFHIACRKKNITPKC